MNTLAAVISQVESAGFPYALRFEDGMYQTTVPTPAGKAALRVIEAGNHCDATTAHMLYCTSFGLFQIMGETLYSTLGWKQSVATFLFDAEQQLIAFAAFCQRNGVDPATFDFADEAALEHFARVYNGPGDVPNYVAKMKVAFAQIGATQS